MKRKLYLLAAAVVIAIAVTVLIACGTGKVTIEFVTGTDEVIPTQVRSLDEAYGELPTPTRKYYKFCGWTTQPDGEETVSASTKPSGGSKYTLYARWEFVGAGRTHQTVATGFYTCYALDDNGELWAWGNNYYGQLGIGSIVNTYEPVKVHTDRKFIEVSINNGVTCYAIDTENKLWAWGCNDGGQIGNGTFKKETTPVEVTQIKNVEKVVAYASHAYALDSDGHIWVWGNFYEMNPIASGGGNIYHPVPELIKCDAEFTDIDTGGEHVLALDKDGHIWTFGDNTFGQLGNGTEITEKVTTKTRYTPKMIMEDTCFTQIAAGYRHSLAIDKNGGLWAWGKAVDGQLGDVSADKQVNPIKIGGLPLLVGVFADSNVSYAIDINEKLWYWGYNNNEAYCGEENKFITSPMKIIEDIKFAEVKGAANFIAKDTDGNVLCWGNNTQGLVSHIDFEKQFTPSKIMDNVTFTQIAAGSFCNSALDSDGNIWSWGSNSEGQLGDGTEENRRTPVQITSDVKYKSITVGSSSSYAIDVNGNIWSWGSNSKGQLGDGTYLKKNKPKKLIVNTEFAAVSEHNGSVFAIDTSGALYAWGDNVGGNLNGDIQKDRILVPTPILTDMRFKYVKYCDNKLYVIDLDWKLWHWDGKSITRVWTDIDVDKLSFSRSDMLVVDKNGNLWGCGDNVCGQLQGQFGEKVDRFPQIYEPQIIDKGTVYKSIAMENPCAFAVTQDGKLVGWGQRNCLHLPDQLGMGYEYEYRLSYGDWDAILPPEVFLTVAYETDVGYSDVVLGYFHGVALDNDGHIWTWGRNNAGQLGNGKNPIICPITKITLA